MNIRISYGYVPHKNVFARRAFINDQSLTNDHTPLFPQHFQILETLAASPGIVSYELLTCSAASKAGAPQRLLALRIAQLRRALAPCGYAIENYRHLGYRLTRLDMSAELRAG